MIRCVNCKAPIELHKDASCWNCNCNTHDHPMRSDLRYMIAYSTLSRVLIYLVLFALVAITFLSGFDWLVRRRDLGELVASLVIIGFVLILSFRTTL